MLSDNTADHGALIIGATGGIGAELSRTLARRGYRLFIHGRDSDRLAKQAAILREDGASQVSQINQDLSSGKDIPLLLDKIRPHQELIDILICSYGPMDQGGVAGADPGLIDRMIDLNLKLPARLVAMLSPTMLENAWGRIVLFGGTGTDSNRAYREIAWYSMAKFGLNSLVRSTAAQFAGSGVTINAILPGYAETEYYPNLFRRKMKKRGKLVSPVDISALILYFLDGHSSVINGALINTGGGHEW